MLLSINTSTVQFSMALLEKSGALSAEVFMTPSSKSFTGFMPILQDMLKRSSLKPDQVEAFILGVLNDLHSWMSSQKLSGYLDLNLFNLPQTITQYLFAILNQH